MKQGHTEIGLNAVIVAVTEETPRILTVRSEAMPPMDHPEVLGAWADSHYALPSGPFEAATHRTLDLGLRRWVEAQAGLTLGYVEQLYTFGDRDRMRDTVAGNARVLSIGYLALVQEAGAPAAGGAAWCDWYRYFPWEDWRDGRPALLDRL